MEGLFFGFAVELSDKVSGNATKMRKSVDLLRVSVESIGGSTKKGFKTTHILAFTRATTRSTKSTKKAKTGAQKFGGAILKLGRRIKKATTNLSFMQRIMVGLGAHFGARAIFRGLRRIVGALADAVKIGSEFGKTMQFAGAVAGASAEDLARMRNEAKRLGATTAFTASQAAEGFVVLAQAGLDVNQSIRLLGPSLNLAGAGMVKLDKATQVTVDAMRVYDLESTDAERITDTLAAGFTSASMSLGQLQLALKQSGPVASAAGKSLEETVAVLGVFANAGFRGSSGGVALRNILAEIQTPTAKLKRALKALNLTMEDLDPATNSLSDIFRRLGPLADKPALAFQLFGKRTAPAFIGAVKQGADAVDIMSEKMGGAKTAAELYMAQLDNVAGAMKILASATEGVKIELFDIIKEQLKDDLVDFSTLMQKAVQVTKNLGPVIKVVFSIISEVFRTIFGRMVGGIDGLSDAFDTLSQKPEDAKKAIADIVGPLTLAMTLIKIQILDFVNGFIDGMSAAFGAMGVIVGPIMDFLSPVIDWFAELFGLTDDGSSKAAKLGKIMGFMFGAFIAFIVIKAALLIPQFVIGSLIKYGDTAFRVFRGVGKAAIKLTSILLHPKRSLAAAAGVLSKAYHFMGRNIKTVFRGLMIAGRGLLKGMNFLGRGIGKVFSGIARFGIGRMAVLAGGFALVAVVGKNVFKALQDDSLSTLEKISFIGKETLKDIIGFIAGLFGVSQERVDLFVEFLEAKMARGLVSVVRFVVNSFNSMVDFFKDIIDQIKLTTKKILFHATELAIGIGRAINPIAPKKVLRLRVVRPGEKIGSRGAELVDPREVEDEKRQAAFFNTQRKAVRAAKARAKARDKARIQEREQVAAFDRATDKREEARLNALAAKEDARVFAAKQKEKKRREAFESLKKSTAPASIFKQSEAQTKELESLITTEFGAQTGLEPLGPVQGGGISFGPTLPPLTTAGETGISVPGLPPSTIPSLAQVQAIGSQAIQDLRGVEGISELFAAPASETTLNFQAGSVVINAAGGDPEEIAKKFLPVIRRIIAEEERRGR